MRRFVSILILVCFLITGQVGQYPVFAQEDSLLLCAMGILLLDARRVGTFKPCI